MTTDAQAVRLCRHTGRYRLCSLASSCIEGERLLRQGPTASIGDGGVCHLRQQLWTVQCIDHDCSDQIVRLTRGRIHESYCVLYCIDFLAYCRAC